MYLFGKTLICLVVLLKWSEASEYCLERNSTYNDKEFIGIWYMYGTTKTLSVDTNLKCWYYDTLFVGEELYFIRHHIDKNNKAHVLTGHAETNENGYERVYDFEKREPESYTVLCFSKDFEIVQYGELTEEIIYVLTRTLSPSKQIVKQIYEVFDKNHIDRYALKQISHKKCGKC